jgi:hypothetical protein
MRGFRGLDDDEKEQKKEPGTEPQNVGSRPPTETYCDDPAETITGENYE